MKQKPFIRGEKVIYAPEKNKVYDFGYISKTGSAIIYEEGCCNMQDACAVDVNQLSRAKEAKPKSKSNLLFHFIMEDQPSYSWERYIVQASGKREALNKLCKKEGEGIRNRKMTIKRVPKNEIITDIY